MAEAPTMLDRLDDDDAEHFAAVRNLLEHAGIDYELDGTLVRGLDYYTRTVFSFECEQLGAQSEIGGGGRYDRLIEELDGPPIAAAGWAAGVERILLALGEEHEMQPHDVFVAARTASASGRWRSSPSCATLACGPSSTSPTAA